MGITFGTVITFKDGGPDPFELNVDRQSVKRAGKKVTISFVNNTAKTVQVTMDDDVLQGKRAGSNFDIDPGKNVAIDLNMNCSSAKHNYSYNFKNEAPPNEEPKIIIDPVTPG